MAGILEGNSDKWCSLQKNNLLITVVEGVIVCAVTRTFMQKSIL